MTRKRLGAIDRESVTELRGAAEEAARERRNVAGLKAPPIAQVAGAAARSIEDEILRLRRENEGLQGQGAAFEQAQRDGLIVQLIPLEEIDAHALSRDRRVLDRDGEEWQELKASLRGRGQQVPVEVSARSATAGKYQLISGYRRLAALQELHAETGEERFARIKALVSRARDRIDEMVAMIEENEIRQDISFYERGRICCIAAEQGICASVDEAIETLFPNSSRNRRYKIRNFTLVHRRLGAFLDYPEAIGERLGGKLAQALKEGRETELAAVLGERETKFVEAADELALLEAFAARKPPFAKERAVARRPEIDATWEGQGGIRAAARSKGGKVVVTLEGLAVETAADLAKLVERVGRSISG